MGFMFFVIGIFFSDYIMVLLSMLCCIRVFVVNN